MGKVSEEETRMKHLRRQFKPTFTWMLDVPDGRSWRAAKTFASKVAMLQEEAGRAALQEDK